MTKQHVSSAVSLKMTLQRSFTTLENNFKLVSELVHFEGTFSFIFSKVFKSNYFSATTIFRKKQ